MSFTCFVARIRIEEVVAVRVRTLFPPTLSSIAKNEGIVWWQ